MGTTEQSILGKVLDVNMIQKILPHRYPFLLVDRVIEVTEQRMVGIKNVTINEPFFQGHFPGMPVMPGVLIIEALAQLGGIGALNMKANIGKLAFFASMDNVRFRRPVVPGDVLRLEVDLLKVRLGMIKIHGAAKVADEIVAEADLMCAIVDQGKKE